METTAAAQGPILGNNRKNLRGRRYLAGWALAAALVLLCACGELRPPPAAFDPQGYAPMDFQDLLQPGRTGWHDGQLVRVKAYFWQFLDYDPAMVRNYLTMARHPLGWTQLNWFAVYGSEEMKGYYDLAALDTSRLHLYRPKRLEPLLLYGQISSLGQGLYLHVHHLEKVAED